jgi:spore coat polysaccharide biosynthesis protein SpsF
MRTVAIIQARMGSTRLPGKVLMPIGERTMLERVVGRTQMARLVDEVVVATTTAPADDQIVKSCKSIDVACMRGSEDDVLDRYSRAAADFAAEAIVRVTSDCPLIDPTVIDLVVQEFLNCRPDYASNTLQRTYPRGLDTEVFTKQALTRASREATGVSFRTHVTSYLYHHPDRFTLRSVKGCRDHSDLRWTVDTELDLEVVRDIYQAGGNRTDLTWEEALKLVRADLDRLARNHGVHQKELGEG